MSRVSNAQLKALLENIDQAAQADHPLAAMYRGFIKDALLDLRDAIAEEARLKWYVGHMDTHIKWLKDSTLKFYLDIARDKLTKSQIEDDAIRINQLANEADKHPHNIEQLKRDAIAPLTGKEK